tara:strand:- start:1026 stop:1502 length:477 start_codon:yes stop_codon:yes gene_type:complete
MDVSKITYTTKNFIKYKSNNLKIRTPPVKIPFGLEESYGKKVLKLQLQGYETDDNMKLFYQIIRNIEQRNMVELGVDNTIYKSALYQKGDYPPLLTVKLEERYGKMMCELEKNQTDPLKTLYDLQRNDRIILDLEFERIWDYKGKCGCIIKAHKIICV